MGIMVQNFLVFEKLFLMGLSEKEIGIKNVVAVVQNETESVEDS